MATLIGRMIGAARLNPETFEEIEHDPAATRQAVFVVAIVSLATGIGRLWRGPREVVVGIVWALVGWALWSSLIYVIGTKVLPQAGTRADAGQVLRVLGFAVTPSLLKVFGSIPFFGGLVSIAATLWMIAAMVVGVRQALDYSNTASAALLVVVTWVFVTAVSVFVVIPKFVM